MNRLHGNSFSYLNGIARIPFHRALCHGQMPSLPEVHSKPRAHFLTAPDLERLPDVGPSTARHHRIALHGYLASSGNVIFSDLQKTCHATSAVKKG